VKRHKRREEKGEFERRNKQHDRDERQKGETNVSTMKGSGERMPHNKTHASN
jgi:hypothetical protein